MTTYVYDRDISDYVPRDEYYARKHNEIAAESKRSDLAFPYVRGDLKPYVSPVTGKVIEGRAARREDLARSGCREVDPSEYKPVYRNYAFCQAKRLPYMGGDVPPPMTKDEKQESKERRAAMKAAEKAATSGPELELEGVKYVRSKADPSE